jgi:hypothetical protein
MKRLPLTSGKMKEFKPQGFQRTIQPCSTQRHIVVRALASTSRRCSGKCACTPGQPSITAAAAAAAAATAAEEVIAIIEEPQQARNAPAADRTQYSRQNTAAAAAGSDLKEPLYKVCLSSSVTPRCVRACCVVCHMLAVRNSRIHTRMLWPG